MIDELEIDVSVAGDIPMLRQPKPNACWATIGAILQSWRRQESVGIENLLEEINEGFGAIFDSDTGLPNEDVPDYMEALGLVAEPPMRLSVQGIADLVARHGPVWVTADEDIGPCLSVHARVIIAVEGDGTPDGTLATIIDPDRPSPITESVATLQEKFNQLATGDMTFGSTSAQFIHFP